MTRAACRAVPTGSLGAVALLLLAACAGTGQVVGPAIMPALPAGGALVGLAGVDLEGMMGEPSLIRADGNAQYWRYSLSGCQLDLFLYADGGRPRVTYVDVRSSRGVDRRTRDDCAELGRRLRAEPLAAPAEPRVSQPF
jgi:hypothetical protein